MYSTSAKIVKAGGEKPDEFEQSISQVCNVRGVQGEGFFLRCEYDAMIIFKRSSLSVRLYVLPCSRTTNFTGF